MTVEEKRYCKFGWLLVLLFFFNCLHVPSIACTDFQVKAKDGTVVIGRSMEWADPAMKSGLRAHKAGEKNVSMIDEGKEGLSWSNRHSYIAVNAYGLDVTLDGMNTAGLSIGLLWLPGTEYETISKEEESKAIDILDVGAWMLGSFSSVDEALKGLSDVKVTGRNLEAIGSVPTVHIALHDASGKNAVIEFVEGKRRVYENKNGVLTNAPTFDWHLTNLSNYININPANPDPVCFRGTVLSMPGQGGGFTGIPGDWTPPSRFVRTSAMLDFAKTPENSSGGVNLAQHILNAVDIPQGDIRSKKGSDTTGDYTQWAIIKDLTNKVIYTRTYEKLNLRQFNLEEILKSKDKWSVEAL